MSDLVRLVQIVRSSDSPRRKVFDAIGQIIERFPSVAHDELAWILQDADVFPRPRVLVLYWLREFGKFEDLVNAHITPLRKWVDSVALDIENDEEEGVDPFL
jgi:hypothetical protein